MESNNKDAIEAVVKALELMVSVCESKEEGVLRQQVARVRRRSKETPHENQKHS
jgi:hypothetical protein